MVIWFLVSFLKKVNEVIWISWLCLSFFISCSSLFLYICSFGILYLLLCSLRQKKSREESFGGSETRSLLRNVEWSGKNMLIPWDRWASLGSLIINLVIVWGNDYNESKFELQEDTIFQFFMGTAVLIPRFLHEELVSNLLFWSEGVWAQ